MMNMCQLYHRRVNKPLFASRALGVTRGGGGGGCAVLTKMAAFMYMLYNIWSLETNWGDHIGVPRHISVVVSNQGGAVDMLVGVKILHFYKKYCMHE